MASRVRGKMAKRRWRENGAAVAAAHVTIMLWRRDAWWGAYDDGTVRLQRDVIIRRIIGTRTRESRPSTLPVCMCAVDRAFYRFRRRPRVFSLSSSKTDSFSLVGETRFFTAAVGRRQSAAARLRNSAGVARVLLLLFRSRLRNVTVYIVIPLISMYLYRHRLPLVFAFCFYRRAFRSFLSRSWRVHRNLQ